MISMKDLVQELKVNSRPKRKKEIKKEIDNIDFFILETLIHAAKESTFLMNEMFKKIESLEKRIKELEDKNNDRLS